MANPTMTLIGTPITVGSGGAASVTFSSIPATYTDLKLVMSARTTAAEYRSVGVMYFNSDTTGANYSYRLLYGIGSGTGSASGTGTGGGFLFYVDGASNTASTFNNLDVYIPNYTATTTKSFSNDGVSETNDATNNGIGLNASLWSGTAAISSITLSSFSGNFAQYSTFYLYGIKNS